VKRLDRPPRPGRGLLLRALIAAVVTVLLSATAVAAAVLLEIKDVTGAFEANGRTAIDIPEVTQAQAGAARTFLILGTDARYGDAKAGLKPRSDTLLLVRVDPPRKRIAVLSIPRDLKVAIPGDGTDKINAAYADGGPRKTVKTIKHLLGGVLGRDFAINNVISVSFAGFRRAVNYVGGVYVDVDRRYYNDNSTAAPGQGYATIDVQPGYQRLKGQDALDYVRYRHGDSDFFRAARQQDFLRQVSHQDGVRKLLDISKRKSLAHIFGKYFEVDKSFLEPSNLIQLAQMGLFLAGKKVPIDQISFPYYQASNPTINTDLYFHKADLRKAVDEFLNGGAATGGSSASGSSSHARSHASSSSRRKHASSRSHKRSSSSSSSSAGYQSAQTVGQDMAVLADPKLSFSFYFPSKIVAGSAFTSPQPRIYTIPDETGHKHGAYRLVLSTGLDGEYYGVQGISWRTPPILDDPDGTRTVHGRKLLLYYNGSHLRIVGWRTHQAAYWISNTLTQGLTNSQMLALAGGLRHLRQ